MNIPIPTRIGSKMGGAPAPKWDPIGFDPQPKPQLFMARGWSLTGSLTRVWSVTHISSSWESFKLSEHPNPN